MVENPNIGTGGCLTIDQQYKTDHSTMVHSYALDPWL